MKIPLHRLGNEAAAEMIGSTAYFTRLYNDLTIRKKNRDCQRYYIVVIYRALEAMYSEKDTLSLSDKEIEKIEGRLAVFTKALDEGRLAQAIDPDLRIYEGGKAGG